MTFVRTKASTDAPDASDGCVDLEHLGKVGSTLSFKYVAVETDHRMCAIRHKTLTGMQECQGGVTFL